MTTQQNTPLSDDAIKLQKYVHEGPIDANALEELAKKRPGEIYLNSNGILTLIGGIRKLERELRQATGSSHAAQSFDDWLTTYVDSIGGAIYNGETKHMRAAWDAVSAHAELAQTGLKQSYKELGCMFHDQIVAQQAAWIEWRHGAGAEAAMAWIENGLDGPGNIPDEAAPYGTEAQAWFDANQSDPFPTCQCGRPSNIAWMGQGFCCQEHYAKAQAAAVAQHDGKDGAA